MYNDITCRYFNQPGPQNTSAVMEAASGRAKELVIKNILAEPVKAPIPHWCFSCQSRPPAAKTLFIKRVLDSQKFFINGFYHPDEKFLEVSGPFFKKVLTRRRQKLAVDLGLGLYFFISTC